MTTSETISESKAVELSAESLKAFCQHIERKFGTHVNWRQKEVISGSIDRFEDHFKNLVAVSSIESHGVLEAGFGVLFDQRGLFIVGGVMLTVAQEKIAENARNGSTEAAEATNEGLKRAGDILADCWQKVLQKNLGQGNNVVHTKTFISKGLSETKEQPGFGSDKEAFLVEYEMAIEPYPPFKCGVIFGRDIFGVSSQDDMVEASSEKQEDDSRAAEGTEPVEDAAGNEEAAGQNEKAAETKDQGKNLEAQAVKEQQVSEQTTQAPQGGEETQQQPQTQDPADAPEGETPKQQQVSEPQGQVGETAEQPPQQVRDQSQPAEITDSEDAAQKEGDQSGTGEKETSGLGTADGKEPPTGPISETIEKMVESRAELPGQNEGRQVDSGSQFNPPAGICARDIMQKEIVWISGDESVQEAISRLQQSGSGYLFIGANKTAEAIVSKSDLNAALSPYLRPIFSKWRQSLDDATLKLKVKWIMSRLVRAIKTDTPLDAVIEQISLCDGGTLAVTDETGKVQGVVTVSDVFKAVAGEQGDIAVAEQPVQAPASTPGAG